MHFAAWGSYNLKGIGQIDKDGKKEIDVEVKELDLEKELTYENYKRFFEEYPDLSNDWGFNETWICAKYFFELGLKAHKGE